MNTSVPSAEAQAIVADLSAEERLILERTVTRDLLAAVMIHEHQLSQEAEPVLVYHAGVVLMVMTEIASALLPELPEGEAGRRSRLQSVQMAAKTFLQLQGARASLTLPPGM
jgi:hypothetical protein